MTQGITGEVKFKCSRCQTQYALASDEFDFEAVGGTERQMGPETEYVAKIDMTCQSCQQEINLRIDVWEYPAGALNHVDHSGSGVSEVKYSFDIKHEPEGDESYNENRIIGSAAGGAILGASLGGPAGAIVGGIIGAILGDSVNKSKNRGAK